jgi:hypothetical protein
MSKSATVKESMGVEDQAVPASREPKKLYVQSAVGRMLDTMTNKEVNEPAFHENTLWLKSQMAAGKIVLADPGE